MSQIGLRAAFSTVQPALALDVGQTYETMNASSDYFLQLLDGTIARFLVTKSDTILEWKVDQRGADWEDNFWHEHPLHECEYASGVNYCLSSVIVPLFLPFHNPRMLSLRTEALPSSYIFTKRPKQETNNSHRTSHSTIIIAIIIIIVLDCKRRPSDAQF